MIAVVRRGAVRGLALGLAVVALPGALLVGKIVRTLLVRDQGFYLH